MRENFKKDFFIYWLGIISDLIAMRIEIEGDSVLIIKEQSNNLLKNTGVVLKFNMTLFAYYFIIIGLK